MEKNEEFYQSKYNYYYSFTKWVIILGSLASSTYIISDWQILGHFPVETIIPRFSIFIVLAIYLLMDRHIKNYKIMVPAGYVVIHCIMWATIWAIVYLPDKQHANEGFIIMHLLFFALGFSAPFKISTAAHSMVAVNIIVSNLFNHYESFWQMLFLGIPCIIAICGVHWIMERSYLEHYLMSRKLQRVTLEDQLTKVYNRNVLRNICEENGKSLRITSGDRSSCVIILDIDFFKQVNDTYGHLQGDKALVFVASVIRAAVRKQDWVLRWGGEEFVIILPDCPLEHAAAVAEKIRQNIAVRDSGVCPLTISAGVALYTDNDLYVSVAEADKALYQAKSSGRNRVITATV